METLTPQYKFINEKKEHLHTFDGKPLTGTSSVTEVLAKPLTWWASGKAVETLGWVKGADWKTLKTDEAKQEELKRRIAVVAPKFAEIKEMDEATFLALLDKAYRAHSENLKKSADKGTDLHAELERFVKTKMGKQS